jgi:O-antigen/teichoic acid export membrane protein
MADSKNLRPPPLAQRLMRGTVWMVAMRWGVRLLGIVSMLVLVRLLQSEDFGLIAMAMAIVALADRFTDFGIVWALVRDKHAGRDEFDTAWTVRQAQLGFVALVAVAFAIPAASLYQDTRISAVLLVIAVSFGVRGFENIGVVEFQRQMEFHREFLFRVIVKFLGVATTIALAVTLRSYWALAWGMLATSLIGVLLSYTMCSYRPRWTLSSWNKLWKFSQWIISQGFARYIFENMPVLFLGRLSTAENVGYYSVSNEIASLPATEVAMPVSRAVLPGFSQLVDEPDRLTQGFLRAFSAVAIVTLPLGLGIAHVAEEIVRLIMGSQWLPAVLLLQVFSIFATFRALESLTANLLVVVDKVSSLAATSWLQALLLTAAIYPAFDAGDLQGVALARALATVVGLIILVRVVVRCGISTWLPILRAVQRPLIAVGVMTTILVAYSNFTGDLQSKSSLELAAVLIAKLLLGTLSYTLVLWCLWRLAGSPSGLEAQVYETLRATKFVTRLGKRLP